MIHSNQLIALLIIFLTFVSTQSSNSTTTAVVPYYSAPNTFTPTATGLSAVLGSTVVITNTAGAGSYTDTFTYVNAKSTLLPYVAANSTATKVSNSTNLQPDPVNLQTAAASKNQIIFINNNKFTVLVITGAILLSGLLGGIGIFI